MTNENNQNTKKGRRKKDGSANSQGEGESANEQFGGIYQISPPNIRACLLIRITNDFTQIEDEHKAE